MAVYAIGDIQGCGAAFEALLKKLRFRKSRDRLWLVGDLVNRGPDSLGVLRRVMALGRSVTCVLGNHDLHLLATVAGRRELSPADTFGRCCTTTPARSVCSSMPACLPRGP
jgi:bis(5'-nucleosyl)-tetraphosphatase (symmetrical)